MVKYNCCVPNCSNSWRNSPGLKFHTIPKHKEVRNEYKRLIRNVNLKEDSTRTRICGAHFPKGERMSRNQLPTIFPWSSLKSPKKRRLIFKHDIDTNKRRKLIFDPPEENKPPEVDLSEIREVVNDLVSNVDKLLQDDLVDVVDSSTTELQGKEDDFEGSDQGATQVKMTQEIEELRKQVKCLQKELRQLKTKPKFDIDEHKDSDDDVAFFTGFPSYDVMLFCFNLLKDKAAVMSRPNFDPNKHKPGTKKKLTLWEEFTLVSMRLRLGLLEKDLAERFRVAVSTVSSICRTWIRFMRAELESICIHWPSKEQIFHYMPPIFKKLYPSLVSIIDCTELQMESPSSLDKKSLCYSSYKSRTTMKALIGITPNGVVSFTSELYCGSISDPDIVKRSGYLQHIQRGDSVMADKGFTIRDELAAVGGRLVLPHFLSGKRQFSQEEAEHNKKIASLRIHVERYMERLKTWHIFDRPIPISLFH
ncbi:uncharacterized protein [Montipora capricornis]|uniref:uncharacterized protein n=1 Tax=Montipora capricornis TaxID=246305 RepID=UPI0035F143C3